MDICVTIIIYKSFPIDNIRNKLNREILTYNKECEWIRI